MAKHRIAEFRLAQPRSVGYDIESVDDFFDQLANDYDALRAGEHHAGMATSRSIRLKTFAPAQGGYLVADVDDALDRIEDRFAVIERREFIAEHGKDAWSSHIEQLAETLMGRLGRADGQRFRRPSKRLTKGYLVDDVDALCRELVAEFKSSRVVDAGLIRGAAFRSATGKRCYEETQVDVFLDRCLELIHDLK